jgi:hypothetical protein
MFKMVKFITVGGGPMLQQDSLDARRTPVFEFETGVGANLSEMG